MIVAHIDLTSEERELVCRALRVLHERIAVTSTETARSRNMIRELEERIWVAV